VGLAWRGSQEHRDDQRRSIDFATLAEILSPACDFVSLQDRHRLEDAALLAASPVRTFGARLADFGDTAALCAAMDLVITVDTSIAHLAGALGKPVWILLPAATDWRWMLDRSDSPWYPRARLIRQRRGEPWSAVLARVRAGIDTMTNPAKQRNSRDSLLLSSDESGR
jgi:ADP-heptose:LPS heptosyltransferase